MRLLEIFRWQDGKKIRRQSWKDGFYIYYDREKKGFVDQSNELLSIEYMMSVAPYDNWELFNE